MRNLYDILGVSRNATLEEINKARIRLSKELHPDVTGGNIRAQEQLKEINAAYSVIKNSESRAKYDRESTLQTNRPTETGQPKPQTVDDIISDSPFGKMWEQMMGTKPSSTNTQEKQQAQKNADANSEKKTKMEEKDGTHRWLERLGKQNPFSQHLNNSGFEHFSDFDKKPDTPEIKPMTDWKSKPSKENKG